MQLGNRTCVETAADLLKFDVHDVFAVSVEVFLYFQNVSLGIVLDLVNGHLLFFY
jgi:hypothetical protein